MALEGVPEMTKNSSKSDTPDRGRFSAIRKSDAVLRLLRGEDLDTLSRELGVVAAALSGWRRRLPRRRQGVPQEPARRRPGRVGRPPPGEGWPAVRCRDMGYRLRRDMGDTPASTIDPQRGGVPCPGRSDPCPNNESPWSMPSAPPA